MARPSAPIPKTDMFALNFLAHSVGPYLEASELAACEQAQLFSPDVLAHLWDEAGLKWLENQPLWQYWKNPFVERGSHGKTLISEMIFYRQVVTMSESFRPWIVPTSLHSIKATPLRHLCATSRQFLARPDRASVTLAVGTNHGQTLVAGMKFAAAGQVNDNLCIGVVAVGSNLSCQTLCVSFAPFSGSCFIEYDGVAFQTQALPRSSEDLRREGHVWIHVTEEGAMQFLRQFKGEPLEHTGLMFREMLPKGIDTYFPSISIWLTDLEAAVDVAVEYSGRAFPPNVTVPDTDVVQLDSTWTMVGA